MEAAALFHLSLSEGAAGRKAESGGRQWQRRKSVIARLRQKITADRGLAPPSVAKCKSRACASVDASGLIAGGSSLHSGATSAITGPRAATQRAVCERWPGTPITLRQGARVIGDSRRLRVVSSP
jgi:hypothetical protein